MTLVWEELEREWARLWSQFAIFRRRRSSASKTKRHLWAAFLLGYPGHPLLRSTATMLTNYQMHQNFGSPDSRININELHICQKDTFVNCVFSGNRGKPEHSCGGWPSNLGQVDEGWPEKGDNTTVKIILKMGLIAKLLTSVLYTLHLPFQMMTLWKGWVVGWAHLCNTPCSLKQFCLLQPHQRTLDTYGAIPWHQQRSWWGKPCKGSLFKWEFNQY